ncbi:MAG: glycosyltransferase, partial [Proteobacteria bacterium]|nr:glycosyltransferase [Pseudomonadota bacterium]
AHEVKNPLTPIQLAAERLRRRVLPQLAQEDASVVDRATATIIAQVESLKARIALAEGQVEVARSQVHARRIDLADMVVRADHHGVFRQLRETGVTVSFMVHDLLPVTMPNVFPPDAGHAFKAWLGIVVKVADVIVCVSRAVKADLERWLATEGDDANPRLRIGWSHHGANIQASAPTRGLPHGAKRVLDKLRKRPSFLCVGTLEPRKGYAQVVDAFEQLWREGVDVNLVIVGKEGWKNLPDEQRRDIPQLAQRLKWHREKGRRLFWLDDISDEYLEQLYTTCDCLLAASLGEGFGLPLIEASRAGIPLLLRDIPVFREVAGNHATYFEGTDAAALAKAITAWIEGKRGDAGTLPQLTWRRSARNLLALIRPPSSDGDTNRARRLYVDVSVVARNDFRTGIQRVVRALFAAMIQAPPQNYEVYPVRLERHAGHWRYEYAGGFLERYCRDGANPRALRGEIETKAGDTLLGLDLAGSMVVDAARDGLYDILRDDGVSVAFVVYDLLPVTAPQFFSDADGVMHEAWLRSIGDADQLLCISETVAEEYRTWYRATFDENAAMPVVQSFPLGCDIENTAPTRGMPAEADPLLAALKARPTFLMVGTLEPRKRYDHALDAFRRLWSEGIDANLVIVGKQGWNVDAFASELRADPEFGRRLHWLEGISDEYLEAVYAAADCLLATSADEGFGLPLIEAARRGLPLLLRDIPVFRELASEHAFYFNGAGAELAAAVREWLALNAEGAAPASNGIRCVTWQESAQALLQRLINASADAESTGMEGRQ